MEKFKIILTDDHQIVLDGLSAILSDYPDYEIIGQANNGIQALELIINQQQEQKKYNF